MGSVNAETPVCSCLKTCRGQDVVRCRLPTKRGLGSGHNAASRGQATARATLILSGIGTVARGNNANLPSSETEKQYADFGSDIQYLARNLEKLSKVIQDVTRQIPQSLSPREHAWDLMSLLKICGDFRKTIRECKSLLDDNSKFGRGRGG